MAQPPPPRLPFAPPFPFNPHPNTPLDYHPFGPQGLPSPCMPTSNSAQGPVPSGAPAECPLPGSPQVQRSQLTQQGNKQQTPGSGIRGPLFSKIGAIGTPQKPQAPQKPQEGPASGRQCEAAPSGVSAYVNGPALMTHPSIPLTTARRSPPIPTHQQQEPAAHVTPRD
jgi:hypothetical protein